MSTRPATAPAPGRAARAISLFALLIVALYALINLSYPWRLTHQDPSLINLILARLVSHDFVFGDASIVAQATRNYERAFAGISTHTLLGALGLMLCTLQFIPALRRRAPRVHRAVGAVAALSVLAAMIGAMAYLYKTPAREVFSGEPFAAALWVQAISTLYSLGLAMHNIRQRNIRAHMGWMALLFTSLLTAPLLRIEYTVVGNWLPYNIAQANAGVAITLFPQAILLATWWMTRIGRRDISLLSPNPSMAWSAWRVLGWLGAATALHEGVLAPLGLDALAPWRTAAERLPLIAGLWGVSAALLMPRLTSAMQSAMWGQAIDRPTLGLGLVSSIGALLIASQSPSQDYNQIGRLFFWGSWGTLGVIMAGAGLLWRREDGQLSPWRVLTLAAWLTPAMWLPVGLALSWTGWPTSAIQTATFTICYGLLRPWIGLPLPGVPAAQTQAGQSRA
jgi:uncharacterized membrane protein YozB (DUF420 family)